MKTTASFMRKENTHDVSPCNIRKIIMLSDRKYQEFSENLLKDYDFIAQSKDEMGYKDDGTRCCLLVMNANEQYGYLVDSSGYDYARYSAYLPNARDFVNAQIKKLADYVVSEGTEHTEDGKWSNSYEEFLYHFDTTVTLTNGIGQLLKEELDERDEVSECIMVEDEIEMTYHLEHCPQCQKGGIAGAMSLISLMGCNLEDVHLCDANEEHELATIVELNENTLTDEGKNDWSDVLNAKVNRIYQGYYGLQLEMTGCPADRLRDFSYMLAGQCSAEDYDRWVAKDEPEQTMKME